MTLFKVSTDETSLADFQEISGKQREKRKEREKGATKLLLKKKRGGEANPSSGMAPVPEKISQGG